MELELPSKTLSDMAQWVTRAVPARPSVPVLAGVSLCCLDDRLIIEASDLDWSFRSSCAASVTGEGRCIVPGKLFADIARALPSEPAHLRSVDTEVLLECGGLEYRFARLPEDEYPAIEGAPDPAGSIDGETLATAIGRVTPAAGRDELLPVFTAVQAIIHTDHLALAATDRYRMATTSIGWMHAPDVQGPATLLVPAKLLAELCRPGLIPEEYEIGWGGEDSGAPDHIGFRFAIGEETRGVRGRLLSGRFPSMKSVLNVPTPLTIWVRTEELQTAVRRIRLTAEPQTPIELTIERPDQLVVSGSSAGRASGKAAISLAAIDSEVEGPYHMAFNPQYLLDAVNTYTTEYLQLRVSHKDLTAILHAATAAYESTDDDYEHVVKMVRTPTTAPTMATNAS